MLFIKLKNFPYKALVIIMFMFLVSSTIALWFILIESVILLQHSLLMNIIVYLLICIFICIMILNAMMITIVDIDGMVQNLFKTIVKEGKYIKRIEELYSKLSSKTCEQPWLARSMITLSGKYLIGNNAFKETLGKEDAKDKNQKIASSIIENLCSIIHEHINKFPDKIFENSLSLMINIYNNASIQEDGIRQIMYLASNIEYKTNARNILALKAFSKIKCTNYYVILHSVIENNIERRTLTPEVIARILTDLFDREDKFLLINNNTLDSYYFIKIVSPIIEFLLFSRIQQNEFDTCQIISKILEFCEKTKNNGHYNKISAVVISIEEYIKDGVVKNKILIQDINEKLLKLKPTTELP